MAKIKKITAREILDSRGVPTIEGKLVLDNDREVCAVASSGESLGKYEGVELRDGEELRYDGMGVKKAVSYINTLLGPKLIGVSPERQTDIDYWLLKADGTEKRSVLGVNTMMIISQLILKASAINANLNIYQYVHELSNTTFKEKIKLDRIPAPIFNMINGGKHGTKNLEFQEFHFIPSTALSFQNGLEMATSLYTKLKEVLDYRNAGTSVSEEGGFTPSVLTNTDALEMLIETLNQRRIRLGVDVFIGLDIAASYFLKNSFYSLKDKPSSLSRDEYILFLKDLVQKYNILLLEDPLADEDMEGWKKLNEELSGTTYIIGDDLIAGNKDRFKKGMEEKACSGVVLKFNQAGTLSELFELAHMAHQENVKIIFSQRLGESNDDIIADIAVGLQADFVKFGAPVRGERVSKYNRLLQIEQEMLNPSK